MICDSCNSRKAFVTIAMMAGNKRVVRKYCPQCAQKLKRGDALGAQLAVLNTVELADDKILLPCPKCATTFETVQKTGRMGCAYCYRAFSHATDAALKKLNGTGYQQAESVPIAPLADETQLRIRTLKGELAQAVSLENYERAAVIRDEINALSAHEDGGNA